MTMSATEDSRGSNSTELPHGPHRASEEQQAAQVVESATTAGILITPGVPTRGVSDGPYPPDEAVSSLDGPRTDYRYGATTAGNPPRIQFSSVLSDGEADETESHPQIEPELSYYGENSNAYNAESSYQRPWPLTPRVSGVESPRGEDSYSARYDDTGYYNSVDASRNAYQPPSINPSSIEVPRIDASEMNSLFVIVTFGVMTIEKGLTFQSHYIFSQAHYPGSLTFQKVLETESNNSSGLVLM
jgi:hypothetical protein